MNAPNDCERDGRLPSLRTTRAAPTCSPGRVPRLDVMRHVIAGERSSTRMRARHSAHAQPNPDQCCMPWHVVVYRRSHNPASSFINVVSRRLQRCRTYMRAAQQRRQSLRTNWRPSKIALACIIPVISRCASSAIHAMFLRVVAARFKIILVDGCLGAPRPRPALRLRLDRVSPPLVTAVATSAIARHLRRQIRRS